VFIYPSNLQAKPKLWLWELRDVAILGVGLVLSALAVAQGVMVPLVVIVLFGFLSIRVEETSVLDFIHYAAAFLFLRQQYYEWRQDP
jgi:hypothetical protein